MHVLLAILLISLSAPAIAQDRTVPYLDGIPAMDGFIIMDDSVLVFDKPEGQITEVSLMCQADCPSRLNISQYYNQAFHNLGWQGNKNDGFYKAGKKVRLDYSNAGTMETPVIITFHSKS